MEGGGGGKDDGVEGSPLLLQGVERKAALAEPLCLMCTTSEREREKERAVVGDG